MNILNWTANDSEVRSYLRRPFILGDWLVATDGQRMIATTKLVWPKIQFSEVTDAFKENVSNLIKPLFDKPFPRSFKLLPPKADLESVFIPMAEMFGQDRKEVTENCYECDGDGVVCFDTHYNHYECDCKKCEGRGMIAGTQESFKECQIFKIDGVNIHCDLIEELFKESAVRYAVDTEKKMFYFSVGIFVGVIMGTRWGES
ncbi:hypothetical protein [Marinicellulosiphila megalodicopiae]|uniref:hypothetical protein n=1 Tax=Marinicellulosiphila megalodicopiae TaxID=2724896 RepID=UPI003BB12B2D